jgi:hypothetical protein
MHERRALSSEGAPAATGLTVLASRTNRTLVLTAVHLCRRPARHRTRYRCRFRSRRLREAPVARVVRQLLHHAVLRGPGDPLRQRSALRLRAAFPAACSTGNARREHPPRNPLPPRG